MFTLRRWWDRNAVKTGLVMLAVGTAWMIRQTNGFIVSETYQFLSRPFQPGPSKLEQLENAYVQNIKKIKDWREAISSGSIPAVQRGVRLNSEDKLRRDVINEFMCHFELDTNQFFENFHWEKDPEESIETDLFEPYVQITMRYIFFRE